MQAEAAPKQFAERLLNGGLFIQENFSFPECAIRLFTNHALTLQPQQGACHGQTPSQYSAYIQPAY